MPAGDFKVLAINPGSTSTKFAVYANEKPEFVKNVRHSEEEMDQFRGRPVLDQKDFRLRMIEREFHEAGYKLEQLSAVAGRGGLLPRLISGAYRVNAKMLADLREAKQGQHASNLGAVLAHALASPAGLEAYIVDPVSVDERPDRSRLSGSALIQRPSLSHMLNPKAIAKRYAREQGTPYKDLRLIVVHMGSGVCVTAHEGGKTIEYNLDVKKSELHGMSQRGGSVSSDVRFGEQVFSPMVPEGEADYLVVISADQVSVNAATLRKNGEGVLIEPANVDEKKLRNKRSINVALLGALSRHLPFTDEQWIAAIKRNLPEAIHEVNVEAFRLGKSG